MQSGPYAFSIGMGNCLWTTHRLLRYRCCHEQHAPSLYHKRSVVHHNSYLTHLFQDRGFFQSGPRTGRSRVVSAQPDLATPSSVLLVPLAFSPCPNIEGGIDLLAIGSSECLSSQLPRAI